MDEQLTVVANEARDAGEQMQAYADNMLPTPTGMYTETALNALINAVNKALKAGGFEGAYPKVSGDVTELPVELVRLLMMLNDAATESGVAVNLDLAMLEDDRDVAMLAAEIARLAEAPEFVELMTTPAEGPATTAPPVGVVSSSPAVAADSPMSDGDAETLMMERM